MDELQNYLALVLKDAKEITAATLFMAGYEHGKKAAESSPFEPQTIKGTKSENEPSLAFEAFEGQTESQNKEIKGSYIVPEKCSKWSVLLFTEKEIQKMPKQFRKQFRVGKIVAHVRKKANGVYEVRCQIDKKQIAASSKNLETAKMKFIEALKSRGTAEQTVAPVPEPAPVTLGEYMLKWLETVKKPTVKEITYKQYTVDYNAIIPVFGDKPLNGIKPFKLQEFINCLVSEGKVQMAKQIATLLKAMFEYAVIDDIITKSPMLKIVVPHVEVEEGVPLSREEEKTLVALMLKNGNIRVQACVFMLYTGLRRSELKSVHIIDGWVHLISAKGRKGYKVKTRSVPVSPMLEPLLPYMDIEGIKNVNISSLSSLADKIIPNHHCHELRHTFITRCQECGIRREIVSLWAGHAADSSITTQVYTHLQTNKDIQLEEIKKFNYDLFK